ncbi:MAG: hypothetical protein HDR46_04205 [Bacteroides sp.]|nr:hypothetical protein [Bacteroides sp.]MBD5415473.1 hypothetical protein [Bacteroides sp.]
MIKENVLKALSALGFIPEEIEEFGYRFDYEDLIVLYAIDDEETKCITLKAPNVFDITDDNRVAALEAMAKLCDKVKYVQPHIAFGNKVWLTYQHYLGDNEVTPELIEHMIRALAYSTITIHNILNGNDNDD